MLTEKSKETLLSHDSITITEALKKIDENALGVLFIVDSEGKLVGALSDGDIRRWLIKTGDLKAHATQAMNNDPKFVFAQNEKDAIKLMDENFINAIPVVDSQMRVINVVDNKNKANTHNKTSKKLQGVPVVMMAGGKGTRLYPYTKILPKPLIPVGDKPISELIIESFCEYGCRQLLKGCRRKI